MLCGSPAGFVVGHEKLCELEFPENHHQCHFLNHPSTHSQGNMSARHCFPSPLTRDKHFLSSSSSLTHTDTEPCEDHVHFADEDNEAPRASEIYLKSQSGSEISHEHHCDVKAWTLSPPSTDTHTHVSALNITMPPRMA